MKTYFYIILFGAFILIAFDKCDSLWRQLDKEYDISQNANIQNVPKTLDEKIDSVKDVIWHTEYGKIDHEFSLDSLMAVIPKEIKKNDKLIEWEKKAMSNTTDTTKSIFQMRKDSDSASYLRKIDEQIYYITYYDSILANYKKSLDSLLQLKKNK